jgi:U4/U6 small nuclear ribonucleoprotein PRP3
MAAHPLLLDTSTPAPQSKKDRYKPMQPKFASIRANARNVPTPPPALPPPPTVAKENPYAAAAASASAETGFEGTPRERVGRSLRFNPKGKYVSLANQMRQDIQLEALKQRIAESARKAGLDSEFDTLEKNIRVRQYSCDKCFSCMLMDGRAVARGTSYGRVVGCTTSSDWSLFRPRRL